MSADPEESRVERVDRVSFEGAGGDGVTGLLVSPDAAGAAPRAGLVLVHDASGLDAHVEATARRLATEGYAVIAPDLHARAGASGARPSDRRVLADLDGALARLVEQLAPRAPAGRAGAPVIGAIGFGAGATQAFLFGCHSDRVDAVVDFCGPIVYPELSAEQPMQPLEMALNLGAPLLGLFAGDDPSIPRADVTALETRLGQFMKRAEVHVFDGVRPGFFDEAHPAHDAQAAARAWELVRAFLDEELAGD